MRAKKRLQSSVSFFTFGPMRFGQECLLLSVSLTLASCSGGGGDSASLAQGPFDEDGNYIEAWADRPPSKSKRKSIKREIKESKTRLAKVERKPKPKPLPIAKPAPIPTYTPPPIIEQPAIVSRTPAPAPARPQPTSRENAPLALASVAPPPKPKPKPQPIATKPKPPVVKPKPEPAPVVQTHTVKKGDTLYSLSRRYETTVSAIQKANGLRGTNIRIGQVLKLP